MASRSTLNPRPRDPSLDNDWKEWKTTHEKQYDTKEEEDFRRIVWEDKLRWIEQHNKEYSEGKHTYTVGMNQFSDLTREELEKVC
ncbi:protein CTLA-2-alpha-like [Erpetoichthys calabaricus]|uniref:protein CTLA-2-alpha-like n=1 Tax=Erpetoichthys calabaricus TaxID=27687 RepID=UPI00109FD895|nr:protein CTLA-2-alpha-like [Erpetoichthys calabaricus]